MKKPVLLIVFNRPDTTKRVFEAIKKAKPPKLFISSDGARNERKGEVWLVNEVRNYVLSNIDWKCEVKTKFNETNLGCGKAIHEAISWFFNNVDDGIIIEDDCLPSASFFTYCEELLDYYRDNKNIWNIGGYNSINVKSLKESYYFTNIPICWGWATWADRWKQYKFDLTDYDENYIKSNIKNITYQSYWLNILKTMQEGKIDTWDYQWVFTILKNNGLCISPKMNLICNIGNLGVHYDGSNNPLLNTKTYNFDNIIHPKEIKLSKRILSDLYKIQYKLKDRFLYNKIMVCNKRTKIFLKLFKHDYEVKVKNQK